MQKKANRQMSFVLVTWWWLRANTVLSLLCVHVILVVWYSYFTGSVRWLTLLVFTASQYFLPFACGVFNVDVYCYIYNCFRLLVDTGLTLPAVFLVAVGFVGCNQTLAVVFVVLSVGSQGFVQSGAVINHIDIAPPFAGVVCERRVTLQHQCASSRPC